MNLTKLQKQAHETAVEKGWHNRDHHDHVGFGALLIRSAAWLARPWRLGPSAMQKLAWLKLVDDELDEAKLETKLDYREPDGKPCGILSEYADALIRVMDMAGACGWRIVGLRDPLHCSFMTISEARSMLVDSIRTGSVLDEYRLSVLFWVIVADCEKHATTHGLFAMVETKMAYNRTRSHRHGGKLA